MQARHGSPSLEPDLHRHLFPTFNSACHRPSLDISNCSRAWHSVASLTMGQPPAHLLSSGCVSGARARECLLLANCIASRRPKRLTCGEELELPYLEKREKTALCVISPWWCKNRTNTTCLRPVSLCSPTAHVCLCPVHGRSVCGARVHTTATWWVNRSQARSRMQYLHTSVHARKTQRSSGNVIMQERQHPWQLE